ncbi:PASTA domain-containing protein [Bacillus timonensis]|nr:PASTA domain-containing protein [Bacillus timonensis]
MKTKNKNINRGAAIVSILFALLFFVLFLRFVHIQVTGEVDGQVLAALAEDKYTRQRNIEANRGSILDRRGQAIAQDVAAYTVVAILDDSLTTNPKKPRHVVDIHETSKQLAPLIKMSEGEVLAILSKDRKQVEFGPNGRNISFSLKQKIESLGLPGIAFIRDTARYYPNGTFASHVVGYAQKLEDDNQTVGMLGIEKSLNDYMKEKDGFVQYQSDTTGLRLPDAKEQIVPPDNGNDIYLTIDQKIQTFLEDAMNKVVLEYEPEKIIGIVADPKTGEILAMGTRPSFNPNIRDISNYLNDAISYRYEPGSTMKIFTLAAAIEEGVYSGDELYQSGEYHIGRDRIRDHNKRGWGLITFNEGVQRSSNVAFAILAKEKLGTDKLMQYISRFGFDRLTGINLDGEVNSIINYKYELDKISTAFGQGSAITPIQQIQAATAIANGGKMMKPYIVDKIIDPDTKKVEIDNQPTEVGSPISQETASKVLDLLETVVSSENGTGKLYNINGYQVAGKTGTAQIPDPEGGYLEGHGNNIFSFLGMAPKDNPRLIVYIAVKQPKLKEFELGSEPVSAIFNPVMKNSLQYLHIEPTEKAASKKLSIKQGIKIGSYTGGSVESVKNMLQAKKLVPSIIGDGTKVIAQIPLSGEKVISGERVILLTDGEVKIPDLIGWSLRDVMKLSHLLKLSLSPIGNGFVYSQNIAPGTKVKESDHLKVELNPPNTKKQEEIENIDTNDE